MESFPFKREIQDDESSRMSDLESDYNSGRRLSTSSSPSSSYKMSIDSDDGRSISSMSGKSSARDSSDNMTTTATVDTSSRIVRPLGSNWTTSNNNIRIGGDETMTVDSCIFDYRQPKKTQQQQQQQQQLLPQKSYDFRERRDPERRNVNRRSSLLPKSKALLRVIDQADEDTHLADIEMRREHETTAQLNKLDDNAKLQQDVPAASWTKVTDTTMPLYQCSKLNPEIEMTNFQLENISSTNQYKSIKRKASEDRFEPYPTSMSLKRRAVSPSVSLNGSPVLTAMSSPPTNFLLYGASNNAAAKAQQKPGFNLHDASGGLSRMSLSE